MDPQPNYSVYLKAWLVLLVITVLMVAIGNRAVLVVGMTIKATIIALWFMHLRYERRGLVWSVVVSLVVCSLLLFGLIAADGMAM